MRFVPRLTLSLLLVLAAAPAARALVFVVDTTSNASDTLLTDDLCDIGAGQCSLRAAIEQANATAGADRIEFAIPAQAPVRIEFGTAPEILETLTIDATTQLGASVNTAATGTNAVHGVLLVGTDGVAFLVSAPNVEIRGVHIQGSPGMTVPCVHFGPTGSGSRFLGNTVVACDFGGVQVDGDRVRIGQATLGTRNLISFNGFGVVVTGNDGFILNNLIGTHANGTFGFGNRGSGVELTGDGNVVTDNAISANTWGLTIDGDGNTLLRNRIGGSSAFGLANTAAALITGSANQIGLPSPTLAHANEIVGNNTGMQILAPGGGNLVQGNRFGGPVWNAGPALFIQSSSGNTVSGNEISNNIAGVTVVDSPTSPAIDNEIVANRIWANAAYDLRLSTSGSPHDDAQFGLPPDYDEGPNHLQNPPHITGVSIQQGQTTVTGNIDANAGRYTLDFYSNSSCVGARRGGEFFLGAATLDATGTALDPRTFFSYALPVTARGSGFTATATDADGNTSEFSTCLSSAVPGGADLDLSLVSPTLASLMPGDTVPLTVRFRNLGPFTAHAVPVAVSLSGGVITAGTPDPAGSSSFELATGVWTVASLGVGALVELDLIATVDVSTNGRLVFGATAEPGPGEFDPNFANNAGSHILFVRFGSDLVISQLAPASAQDGDPVSFDVTVTNTGPEDASSVTVSGRLDEGLVFEDASVPAPGFSFDEGTRRWSWHAGPLADQAATSVTVNARVDAALAPDIGLEHIVYTSVTPLDPSPAVSTRVVGLGAAADLALSKIAHFDTVSIVDFRTVSRYGYTFEITNHGPDPIDGFVLQIGACGDQRLHLSLPGDVQLDPASQPYCPTLPAAPVECPVECRLTVRLESGETRVLVFESNRDFDTRKVRARVDPGPAFPFYEVEPSNNELFRMPTAPCGLLGIESPLLLGLVVLLRGRKGRAAFRRIFPGAALAMALLLGGSARTAHATPVALAIDSGASSATVAVTSPLGSPPPVAVTLSGSVDADVTLGIEAPFGLVAQSLQLTDAAIALSDSSIGLSSVLLYDLTFSSNGVGGSLVGPAASGFAVAPGLSLFDLFGSSLTFDAGTVDATGTYYGFGVSESLDLSGFPLHSVFPVDSAAQIQVVDLGGGAAELRLTFPFSTPLNLVIDSEPVTVTIAGTLVARGQVVPEPGTAPLLAAGLLAFAVLRRTQRPDPFQPGCLQRSAAPRRSA